MIKLEGVTKSFARVNGSPATARPAVDNVSFEVGEGETLVLLGTSGSGKTTTLRMINRLVEPSGGAITIQGRNIQDVSPETLRRGMGYVLQESGLFPHYTVAENIAVVPRLLRWDARRIAERTTALLEKLSLPPDRYRDAYPSELSGGQAQRVGLARALVADQPILLMDEPFGALDPITRVDIRKDFKSLNSVNRRTVILVTHDVEEAFELGDRVVLMTEGRIAQWGSPADLLFRPASDFVRAFFESQRLALELGVVRVRDVWEALPPSASGAAARPLSADAPLREALEATLAAPDDRVALTHDGATKTVGAGDLFTAFHAYKNR